MKWRLIKAMIYLLVLGAIALVGYAYIGPVLMPQDFEPPVRSVTQDITLPVAE